MTADITNLPNTIDCSPNMAQPTKFERVIREILKIDPQNLPDETTMQDVQVWDSLRHLELIIAIEESIGRELTFAEINGARNLGAIRKFFDVHGD